MSSRGAIGLIGLALAVFWVFGLMLALDRARVDEAFILPSLKGQADYEITAVDVQRAAKGKEKESEEFRFIRKDDAWLLQQGNQSVKVEGFRIKDLIRDAREARRDEESGVVNDPSKYGLAPPQATIVLTGTRKKRDADKEGKDGPTREWKIMLGNDSVDKKYVYAASSDRPGRVFAVPKSAVASLFFKSVNDLRSKRIFDYNEPSALALTIKRGAKELSAKKNDDGQWVLTEPNLGIADYDGPPAPKDPTVKAVEGGIKGLLNAIVHTRVDAEDDFVPPAPGNLKRFELEPGQESMKITVKSGDIKSVNEETLLIGQKEKDYYYARLATDEGVFKIKATYLDAIEQALAEPAKLRNIDLAPSAVKDADVLVVRHGKDEAKFFHHAESKNWKLQMGPGPRLAANNKAVDALVEMLQGKREIVSFIDAQGKDAGKLDTELGVADPKLSVSLYLKGAEPGKEDKTTLQLKAAAKPAVIWQFGNVDKDLVNVKRTLGDGTVSRFTVNASLLEKIVPREGLVAFVEPTLPKYEPRQVAKIEIDTGGKRIVLRRDKGRWSMLDAKGETISADPNKVEMLATTFSRLQVKRWAKALEEKQDLGVYGLKQPPHTLTLHVRKDEPPPELVGSVLGQIGSLLNYPALAVVGGSMSLPEAFPGEKIVITFGKEEKDPANTVYVKHSGADRIGLLSEEFVKMLKNADFRDRSLVLRPQVEVAAHAIGAPVVPMAGLFVASPIVTGGLGRKDASQVKELRLAIRSAVELRHLAFVRKDKAWVDQSGLKEFQLNEDRANDVANLVAGLRIDRVVQLAGGPKSDQKLTPAEASVVIEAVMDDGQKTVLLIGAEFESRGYFAQVSTWPEAVFLMAPSRVQPLLEGLGYFAKERVARGE